MLRPGARPSVPRDATSLVPIDAGHAVEVQWIARDREGPLLVFLHEGLGSVAMWRGWPREVCDAAGARGLVYSRVGYGRSTPRPHGEPWQADFMHVEARERLPALLQALGIDAGRDRPWLVGHSDGGSIALIHAASFPGRVAGLVVIAPHIMVEDVSIASIEKARDAYYAPDGQAPGLRARLSRYHDDVESAFGGWCGAWLAPAFRRWSIEAMLADVRQPVLAVQGDEDEYGTLAQVQGIARAAPDVTLEVLEGCGHSPHRDAPRALAAAIAAFVRAREPGRSHHNASCMTGGATK